MEPIKGVTFNVVRTSDGKLILEWTAVDVINRQQQTFRTVHENFEGLSAQLKTTLNRASVL